MGARRVDRKAKKPVRLQDLWNEDDVKLVYNRLKHIKPDDVAWQIGILVYGQAAGLTPQELLERVDEQYG